MGRISLWVLIGITLLAVSFHDLKISAEVGPSESECRPYIEKALYELKTTDSDGDEDGKEDIDDDTSKENQNSDLDSKESDSPDTKSGEQNNTEEDSGSNEDNDAKEKADNEDDADSEENKTNDDSEEAKVKEITNTGTAKSSNADNSNESGDTTEDDEEDGEESKTSTEDEDESKEDENDEKLKLNNNEKSDEDDDNRTEEDKEEDVESKEEDDKSKENDDTDSNEDGSKSIEDSSSDKDKSEKKDDEENSNEETNTNNDDNESDEKDDDDTKENSEEDESRHKRSVDTNEDSGEDNDTKEVEDDNDDSKKEESSKDDNTEEDESTEQAVSTEDHENDDDDDNSPEEKEAKSNEESDETEKTKESTEEESDENETDNVKKQVNDDDDDDTTDEQDDDDDDDDDDDSDDESEETRPEDDLLLEGDIPENLRDRKHISELLHLDNEFEERENAINYAAEIILRDLKRIYENAIKPLEGLYKYRDLSNRHFGDPEIFSKPLVLFMGPWSGGKSTIINYLTGNEYTDNSLRSGAEPSPAYFNILMHGKEPEVLDGTQLAADWTFSGLQKFGQGLEDRLRGLKLPSKLLEKVNIVEIPGILEVRKQVSRLFPFNDACQWFIDRADIIFLVYDPAKLDVGPETEAILDQLKGREYQTRIVLNKADIVKPEELLRVQSALIWNISPLMSSAQPPVMYTTSLWSHPYETSSPVRLLQAQERAFLRDLRTAVDKRIENKIASARRFAVRVRNHAKMVDCYLTTYYNHKSLFGNKKRISDQIIQNPQNYHIYEGLSTLTNISRYDLPDPEVYRDFFRLNPLYEFKKLSETCTYFRGCPINKLDVAIAYDLPELGGKYKKMVEFAMSKIDSTDTEKEKS